MPINGNHGDDSKPSISALIALVDQIASKYPADAGK